MNATEELARYRDGRKSVLTIGTFDGVHVGHRLLINHVQEEARRRGIASAVVTFHPIPRTVLFPDQPIPHLTSIGERVELIKGLAVDKVVPLTFTRELSQVSAHDFVRLLVDNLGMEHLVAGPDFALGRNREGNMDRLAELGRDVGFTVGVMEPKRQGNEVISSTTIRRAIADGNLQKAARYLDRPYALSGPVVQGEHRGKDMGFPTANIQVDPTRAVPPEGVYVTWAVLGHERLPSVTNIGTNPTFGNAHRTVETFILDFDRTIYGKDLYVEFLSRLRDEVKFPSTEALVKQIHKDVAEARSFLARSHG